MAPATCSCSNAEKVVLLVGCTQHGKSSLIRSILDYSGAKDKGDRVKVGTFGNTSTTKQAKTFSETIHIQQHSLYDNRSRIHKIIPPQEEPDDLFDLIPKTTGSGKHIHLRVIDTPGLDDTDNNKEPRSRPGPTNTSLVRHVDEQHKLKVFQKLAEEGSLNAICFVLDINSQIGSTAQTLLKEYMHIFDACKLHAPYYFIHTKVNIETMFEEKARQRPASLQGAFSLLHRKVKHHYIDNLPSDECEIEKHFHRRAIAGLLEDLLSEPKHAVMQLRYPRSAGHKSWDRELDRIFQQSKSQLDNEVSLLETAKEHLESTKLPLERRKDQEYSNYRSLDRQYDALNTDDLVEVGKMYKSERSHLFGTSRLWFTVSARAPIRKFEASESGASFWADLPSQSSVYGENSMSAFLKGYGWDCAISATITLYGWQKEAEGVALKRLENERKGAYADWEKTVERVKSLTSSIETKEKEIVDARQAVARINAERRSWQSEHIDMTSMKRYAPYFGTTSIVAYAYGLRISRRFPQKALGEGARARLLKEYDSKISAFEQQVTVCKEMVKLTNESHAKSKSFLEDIRSQHDRFSKDIKGNHNTATSITSSNPSISIPTKGINSKDSFIMQDMQEKLESRIAIGKTLVVSSIKLYGRALQEQSLVTKSIIPKAEKLADSCKVKVTMWEEEQLNRESAHAAAEVVKVISNLDSVPIGVAAVFQATSESNDASWEPLFENLKSTYSCKPEGWAEFLHYLKIES
ncbi:hypothetical protein BDV96DRAFT_640129 [Lophiotrema nucula]|uniref:Uncharacterized protein n=1 Tax=Lophiotrema nucula TaxID=690887 RepID=A0A6A5ZT77_9PLEO|nr:hypothetical protein BDV96DRAFT_640129 [Lophiotrema nucula]